jgi:hypothetical protein
VINLIEQGSFNIGMISQRFRDQHCRSSQIQQGRPQDERVHGEQKARWRMPRCFRRWLCTEHSFAGKAFRQISLAHNFLYYSADTY